MVPGADGKLHHNGDYRPRRTLRLRHRDQPYYASDRETRQTR
jgi:hypothetical protein